MSTKHGEFRDWCDAANSSLNIVVLSLVTRVPSGPFRLASIRRHRSRPNLFKQLNGQPVFTGVARPMPDVVGALTVAVDDVIGL